MQVLARTGNDWTDIKRGRGRNRLKVADVRSMNRAVETVAFDEFVFDEQGLTRSDGATVMRGVDRRGRVLAVASMPWPDMPVDWAALQSRSSDDLLGLEGDEMEPVGHRTFDERFSVDADDVSEFRRVFRTSLREWLVEFDTTHGPLIVLFDGPEEPEPEPATDNARPNVRSAAEDGETPRRRRTDIDDSQIPRRRRTDTDDVVVEPPPAEEPVPPAVPTVFVARQVDDDESTVDTLGLAVELTEHVSRAAHR